MNSNSLQEGIIDGMQRLGGFPRSVGGHPLQNPSDIQVTRELVVGRRLLTQVTGHDLGFDIERWISLFESHPRFGLVGEYTHPGVHESWTVPVIARQKSPEFRRYILLAEAAWQSGLEADISYEDVRQAWFDGLASIPPDILP